MKKILLTSSIVKFLYWGSVCVCCVVCFSIPLLTCKRTKCKSQFCFYYHFRKWRRRKIINNFSHYFFLRIFYSFDYSDLFSKSFTIKYFISFYCKIFYCIILSISNHYFSYISIVLYSISLSSYHTILSFPILSYPIL